MPNIITIELCAEDRARLDRLTAALESANKPKIIAEETIVTLEDYGTPETATETPQKADEADGVQTTQPETETPKEVEKPATPTATVEDLRSKYMSLAATPKREQARMLIKLYAEKISDIPEDKRDEVLEKLTALEKQPALEG